jgi:hypothetical protein
MNDAEFRAYIRALYERRATGVPLRRARPMAIPGWQPEMHGCYQNVDMWIHHNPQYQRVDGFLYFDFDGYADHVLFVPHAVVQVEDGTLVDITPEVVPVFWSG